MTTQRTAAELDTLTRQATAFDSFSALLAKCDTGYVPSLYGNAKARRLADEVEAAGRRVWRGL